MREISRPTEKLLASQDGLCSMNIFTDFLFAC